MNEYSINMDRLEANCRELMRRRTTRILTKHIRRERAMERREKLREIAGKVMVAALFAAIVLPLIVMS